MSAQQAASPAPAPSAAETDALRRRSDYAGVFVFQGLSVGDFGPLICHEYYLEGDAQKLRLITPDGDRAVPGFDMNGNGRHVFVTNDACPAHVIAEHAGRVELAMPSPDDPREAIIGAPVQASGDWIEYRRPEPGTYESAFRTGQTLYWMDASAEGCVGQRVAPLHAQPVPHSDPTDADVRTFVSRVAPAGARWGMLTPQSADDGEVTTPFLLVIAAEGNPLLLFGTEQQANGHPFWKCRCERLFRLLNIDGDELHVLARVLPSDPEVLGGYARELPAEAITIQRYDAAQIERWFFRKGRCERALADVRERILHDGRLATRLGLHAGY